MDIKFIELLSKTGSQQKALFEVGAQKIIIGVGYSLLSNLGMPSNSDSCVDFLKEFGILKIQLMIAENNLQKEYIFLSHDFEKMTREEMRSYFKNKIVEIEKKSTKLIDLEIDAKHEVEWFKRFHPTHSTEEILLDMAKYLVRMKRKSDRQENFLMIAIGSGLIGSIFATVLALVSYEWELLFWSVIVFIVSFSFIIYIYGTNKNPKY